jgi:hypothetical protein
MAKKCKVCGEKFTPTFTSFQKTCNATQCLVAFGKTERIRINRKETKESKRDRSYWMRRCQTEFNKYIRNRDKKDPCISCNRPITMGSTMPVTTRQLAVILHYDSAKTIATNNAQFAITTSLVIYQNIGQTC